MELFKKDGHLSREGLNALVAGGLNELERLETAEHLDFCDDCLEAHMALLTEEVLVSPEKPLAEPVLRRLGRKGKTRRVLWARYGTVAVAACLALVVWGVSSMLLPGLGSQAGPNRENTVASQALETDTGGGFWGLFAKKEAADPTKPPQIEAPQPPQIEAPQPPVDIASLQQGGQGDKTPQEMEAVFEQRRPAQDKQTDKTPEKPERDGGSSQVE